MFQLDARYGFVPPKDYKPSTETHIDPFNQDERIYSPLFRQLCDVVKGHKDGTQSVTLQE